MKLNVLRWLNSLKETSSKQLQGKNRKEIDVVFFFSLSCFLSECSQYLENIVLGVTSRARNGVWSEPCCAVDWEEIMGPGRVGTIEEQFFD